MTGAIRCLVASNLFIPVFNRIFCAPASFAPVESIFSQSPQSRLLMRPNIAKMSHKLLEQPLFLNCNAQLLL